MSLPKKLKHSWIMVSVFDKAASECLASPEDLSVAKYTNISAVTSKESMYRFFGVKEFIENISKMIHEIWKCFALYL